MKQCRDILNLIKSMYSKKDVEGMARFGINPANNYGVSVTKLRKIAKGIEKNHELAQCLWNTGVHDARILAILVDEHEKVTSSQMDSWVKDFDSWDVCDLACLHLFFKTPNAHKKAVMWCKRKRDFERRAGFVMIAVLAVKDKESVNNDFDKFFSLIEKYSDDERNFVKKSVNWALRQIGKRNLVLNKKAIRLAKKIEAIGTKSGRWIARDALRELQGDAVKERLENKQQ